MLNGNIISFVNATILFFKFSRIKLYGKWLLGIFDLPAKREFYVGIYNSSPILIISR